MPTARWNVHRRPRAEGRTFLVTGANAGIGYFVAEQLAGTGATVVLGSRNTAKADAALTSIRSRVPDARVRHLRLDLADLSSLESSVDALDVDRLDAVVCNAGAYLDEPDRRETADGHELMFATNHLGHFTLVHRLLPLHTRTTGSRLRGLPAGLVLQGKEAGAWPAVRAVLDPGVEGGQLLGPRVFGLRGRPRVERVRGRLADPALAAEVWSASVALTGVEPGA
jgi:NAD(P)-dependent dehydrogenase (short-subunit alcohol dehydrogenase family)